MLRVLTVAGGLAGAAMLSQFPEFSQQYTQRLGGAVDALAEVVADFDASAAAEGLAREEALQQMTGTAFLDRRRQDMERSFARYENLSQQLLEWRRAGPFRRAAQVVQMDGPVARATLREYQPALPLTPAGGVFGGGGFVLGAGVVRLLGRPFRRTA